MKPIDSKMRTHFTIQDSKNVRNTTKRIKKILDNNYKRANLKKIVNNFKYLSNDKQSLILKLWRKHKEQHNWSQGKLYKKRYVQVGVGRRTISYNGKNGINHTHEQ